MSRPLYALTATEMVAQVDAGATSAEAIVRACIERIREREPDVGAWAYFNPEAAIAAARAADGAAERRPLRGIPVGFKDVIDTADMPTGYGSLIYYDHRPHADAACVALARAGGATIFGKTVSTEFASRDAGKTSNPHDRRFSPGGSSSGSAAAVGAGMVPIAVGSQTGGSVIRPASYCGVYALKPTFGVYNTFGARGAAASFDTLGWMARSVDDLALYRSAVFGPAPVSAIQGDRAPRLAVCRLFWEDAEESAREMVEDCARRLAAAGASVSEYALPVDLEQFARAYSSVYAYEAGQLMLHDWMRHPDSVGPSVRAAVEEGRQVSVEEYGWAIRVIETVRDAVDATLEDVEAIVTTSAPGEAPRGLSDTGPITFNFLWTAAHTPAITLPVAKGPNGLPLGLQLIGRRYDDDRLLSVARWVDSRLKERDR